MGKITINELSESLLVEDIQTREDNSLNTNSKTVAGAINELNSYNIAMKNALVDVLNENNIECDYSYDWYTLWNLLLKESSNPDIGIPDNEEPEYSIKIGEWSTVKDIGTGRASLSVCANNGYIYCLGGIREGSIASNLFNRYNPKANTWETLTPCPRNLFGASMVAINDDYIYVFTRMLYPGATDSGFCIMGYSIQENTWSEGSTVTSNSDFMPDCAFKDPTSGRVYLLVHSNDGIIAGKVYTNHSGFDYVYDSGSSPIFYLGSANCYHNRRIYSIGGYTGNINGDNLNNNVLRTYNTLLAFDIASERTMQLASLPIELVGACAEVYEDKIYVFGGQYRKTSESTTIHPNSNMYVYDIANDSWTVIENSTTNRSYASSCVINNSIYVIGGKSNSIASNLQLEEVTNVSSLNQVYRFK